MRALGESHFTIFNKMAEEVEQFVQGLKVTELREELKKRGLSSAGNKAILAQRLKTAMKADVGENGEQEGWFVCNQVTLLIIRLSLSSTWKGRNR